VKTGVVNDDLYIIRTKSVCGQRAGLAARQSWLRAKQSAVAVGATRPLRRGAGIGSDYRTGLADPPEDKTGQPQVPVMPTL